jgi:NAD(P)H-dependent FMN reductase
LIIAVLGEDAVTKTLIAFHSRTGYTRRVAQELAGRLDADLDEIQIVQSLDGRLGYLMCAIEAMTGLAPALRPSRKDPANYDLVVVGTPVWFWSLASPVRSWLEEHPLRERRFGFFCTMGGSGASCVFATMAELAGDKAVATLALTDHEIDAGADAQVDGFVRTLRAGRRRRNARVSAGAHATA